MFTHTDIHTHMHTYIHSPQWRSASLASKDQREPANQQRRKVFEVIVQSALHGRLFGGHSGASGGVPGCSGFLRATYICTTDIHMRTVAEARKLRSFAYTHSIAAEVQKVANLMVYTRNSMKDRIQISQVPDETYEKPPSEAAKTQLPGEKMHVYWLDAGSSSSSSSSRSSRSCCRSRSGSCCRSPVAPATFVEVHTQIHTYIQTHIHNHTSIHTYTHTYMHTYEHTYMYTYMHTYIQTYRQAYVHPYISAHTYIHTYIHRCRYVHVYVHTYTHT